MVTLELSKDAFALQPVRLDERRNAFIFYEGTTFPDDPYGGCELYLRRCNALGMLADKQTGLTIDVLDKNADIIQEFHITKRGFEYLRRSLKFKREWD